MSIFDEEITPTSLEDIGFVSIGKGKWMYIFASQFDIDYDGGLKFAFDEFIYNEKKKILSTKYSKQKFPISDLQDLKLTVETMTQSTLIGHSIDMNKFIEDFRKFGPDF